MMSRTLPLSDGASVRLIEAGRGDPLLLIHGLGMRAEAWEPQMAALSAHHHVIAVDMPGHGASSLLPAAARLPDFVAWAARLVEALDLGSVNLAGHSIGALVAAGLAVERPNLVRRLALLNAVHRRSPEARAAVLARADEIARRSALAAGRLHLGQDRRHRQGAVRRHRPAGLAGAGARPVPRAGGAARLLPDPDGAAGGHHRGALCAAFLRLGLNGTLVGFVIAHLIVALPFAIITISGALETFAPSVEDAAILCGASPWEARLRVTLPAISHGLFSAAILSFLISWDEVVLAIFMASPTLQTLPVKVWTTLRQDLTPVIAAASTLLVLLTVVLMIAAALIRKGKSR
ncbi:alpha/beta fold hydrolase (plasmid) [Paracoccus ferrooxidans]|nr:alpha/beta fold hydrolase [Paracoccus ferrooxidans]